MEGDGGSSSNKAPPGGGPGSGGASKKAIFVHNVASAVTPDILQQFFGNVGTVVGMKTLGFNPTTDTKQYLVVFEQPQHCTTALLLNGTTLLGKAIIVTLADGANAPSIPVLPSATSSPSVVPTSIGPPILMSGLIPPQLATLAASAAANPLAALQRLGVAPPSSTGGESQEEAHRTLAKSGMGGNMQNADEVARTIYVGNINGKITAEQLMSFFQACGPIGFCRMAGDESHPARFAFIEFETIGAATAALALNGTNLVDRPIKVNHSKNPIVKPIARPPDPRREREAQDAVRVALMSINRKLGLSSDGSTRQRSSSRERHSHRYRTFRRSRSRRVGAEQVGKGELTRGRAEEKSSRKSSKNSPTATEPGTEKPAEIPLDATATPSAPTAVGEAEDSSSTTKEAAPPVQPEVDKKPAEEREEKPKHHHRHKHRSSRSSPHHKDKDREKEKDEEHSKPKDRDKDKEKATDKESASENPKEPDPKRARSTTAASDS
ncbi:splicing regulatory glutamine/lysine-rich protein 1 [Pelomyxa schiedti]|nr:splicing regulatory glutamine/lysine-rich protein 1 [Pelomyxa schiedti]